MILLRFSWLQEFGPQGLNLILEHLRNLSEE